MRRALVALAAAVGLVALLLGVAMRTVWLPEDQVSASVTLTDPGPLVHTAPGLLESRPGPVTVTARSADGGPVVLAIGRERDVLAYAEGVAVTVLERLDPEDPDTLRTQGRPGAEEPVALGDPAASDLWVESVTGEGSATLRYGPPQGRWLVVVASDGTAPAAQEVTVTWPREVVTPWSTPLVLLGLLALAGALALVLLPRVAPDALPGLRRRAGNVARDRSWAAPAGAASAAAGWWRGRRGESGADPAPSDPGHQDADQDDASEHEADQHDASGYDPDQRDAFGYDPDEHDTYEPQTHQYDTDQVDTGAVHSTQLGAGGPAAGAVRPDPLGPDPDPLGPAPDPASDPGQDADPGDDERYDLGHYGLDDAASGSGAPGQSGAGPQGDSPWDDGWDDSDWQDTSWRDAEVFDEPGGQTVRFDRLPFDTWPGADTPGDEGEEERR